MNTSRCIENVNRVECKPYDRTTEFQGRNLFTLGTAKSQSSPSFLYCRARVFILGVDKLAMSTPTTSSADFAEAQKEGTTSENDISLANGAQSEAVVPEPCRNFLLPCSGVLEDDSLYHSKRTFSGFS